MDWTSGQSAPAGARMEAQSSRNAKGMDLKRKLNVACVA